MSAFCQLFHEFKYVLFCSENYLVRWGSQGLPRNIERLNNLKAIFTVCAPVLNATKRCGLCLDVFVSFLQIESKTLRQSGICLL